MRLHVVPRIPLVLKYKAHQLHHIARVIMQSCCELKHDQNQMGSEIILKLHYKNKKQKKNPNLNQPYKILYSYQTLIEDNGHNHVAMKQRPHLGIL